MKTKWLDRDTVRAPYTTLCLNERAYLAAVRHLKVPNPDPWIDPKMFACVHTFEAQGKLTCVVCIGPRSADASPIELACTLVHESVHIYQRLCESIGETRPGKEFEAYTIERIAERLMREYVRQTTS